MTSTNYQQQAQEFLNKTETTFKANFSRYGKHFPNDKDERDIYDITFKRGNRVWQFKFGQSVNASGAFWLYGKSINGIAHLTDKGNTIKIVYVHENWGGVEGRVGDVRPSYNRSWDKNKNYAKPSAYDVLACITKNDPGTFENFCSEFGYEQDSRTAEKVYQAVVSEWENVKMLWSDKEIEELQEIQ